MVKKKRKFTKEGWEKLKSQVSDKKALTMKEFNKRPAPETIGYPSSVPFNHPTPNSADFDMIYLRGKK